MVKHLFWSVKRSLDTLKLKGFLAYLVCLHMISLLYILHNLIKGKLTELIIQTFNREGSLYLSFNADTHFPFLNSLKDLYCGYVRTTPTTSTLQRFSLPHINVSLKEDNIIKTKLSFYDPVHNATIIRHEHIFEIKPIFLN